jgi:hypothetical protein
MIKIDKKVDVGNEYYLDFNSFHDLGKESIFFNSEAYHRHHSLSNHDLYVQFLKNNKLLATLICHYDVDNNSFTLPQRGTYCKPFFNNNITFNEISFFIYCLIEYLNKEFNFNHIVIKSPPTFFLSTNDKIFFYLLLKKGFKVNQTNINNHIIIDSLELKDKVNNRNARYLKNKPDLIRSLTLDSENLYIEAYNLIKNNRMENNYLLSMSENEIMNLKKKFPEDVKFFATFVNQDMVASAITIKINSDLLYVFYWANIKNTINNSLLYLCEFIYSFAKKNGFKYIDLGTSSVNGILNINLLKFKKSLGAETSVKFNYYLNGVNELL